MKSTYEIQPNENLFKKTHRGVITADDEIRLLDRILSDPDYRKGMNAICDFSQASVNWSLSDVDKFRAYIAKIKHLTGKCRWAIIFPKGKDTSTVRIFIALNEAFEESISVKLFESVEDAEKWIEGVHTTD